jgi:hypothetical protein
MTVSTTEGVVFNLGDFDLGGQGDKGGGELPEFNPSKEPDKASKSLVRKEMANISKASSRLTDDEVKEHQSLVLMLSRYGQSRRFADYLKSMNFSLSVSVLKKMGMDDLKEELTRVKTCIDNKNVSNFWEEMALGVIQTGEVVCSKSRLGEKIRIQGLTELLRNDETFLDLLEQLELENSQLTYCSPYVRLVYAVATAGTKIHAVNTMLARRTQHLVKPAEAEVKTAEAEVKTEEVEVKTEQAEVKTEVKKEAGILSFVEC